MSGLLHRTPSKIAFQIHEDNQRILQIIDQIYRQNKCGDQQGVIRGLLDELCDLACRHFVFEEDLMARTHYKDFKRHYDEHMGLIEQLDKVMAGFERNDRKLGHDVITFCRDWLKTHTQSADQDLIRFLESRDAGDAPGNREALPLGQNSEPSRAISPKVEPARFAAATQSSGLRSS
ncbi:hypothetical protein WCLP8_3800009 [uncultured Gammaproteobacteria bacterium]